MELCIQAVVRTKVPFDVTLLEQMPLIEWDLVKTK